ncbi:DUF1285 domain-containing protein [Shewanella sp. A25]|nr:DUF1285 domain-containing protein [Shewanella shenzhenensis]
MEQRTDEAMQALKEFKPPQTTPVLCSETALFTIQSSGDWLYQGSPLPKKFAKLFASILHCDNEEYVLITPVEKVRVEVEDAPLIIVEFSHELNTGLLALRSSIDTEHHQIDSKQMRLTDFGIYLPLERRLWGKLSRACYYNFVNEFNLSDEN